MKRKTGILVLCLLILCVLSLPAVDFGGTLDNATAFGSADGSYFDQSDKLSLWFNTGTEKKVVFSIMGSYTFSLDRLYLFDVDDLRLYGDFPAGEDGVAVL